MPIGETLSKQARRYQKEKQRKSEEILKSRFSPKTRPITSQIYDKAPEARRLEDQWVALNRSITKVERRLRKLLTDMAQNVGPVGDYSTGRDPEVEAKILHLQKVLYSKYNSRANLELRMNGFTGSDGKRHRFNTELPSRLGRT